MADADRPHVELTDTETRVLTFFAFSKTGQHRLLLKAMALSEEEWDAAIARLLSVGLVEPCVATRQ